MIFFIKFAKTEIIGTLKIKWVNGGTIDLGTFVIEKRGNKSKESNQKLRTFAKKKDVLPIPIFADQDIPQRGKY